MDLQRDKILKDLNETLLHRCARAAEDLAQLCDAAKIPRYEFGASAAATFLFLFMGLTLENKPQMTPEELAFLVRESYTQFRKQENSR